MSQLSDEVLLANRAYADTFGRKADLALPPARHLAILTCMDEWFVIHHTNCGMELFSDEIIGDLLEDDLGTASFDGTTWSNPKHEGGCSTGHFLKWHTITDGAASVIQDVRRIHEHPLVPKTIPIHGYIYDVKTGRLNAVDGASVGGAAR